VTGVKRILLDTLGTTLAATTLGAGCREVVDVAVQFGGKPESTIFGSSHKVAAPHAAMANGALAHALNYDAIGPQVGHVGLVAMTPLAMAEAIGGVSGKKLLTAITAASEVTSRITAAQAETGEPSSVAFLAGQVFGYFGAAAGAGQILGINELQMRSAFGLALMQASGTMQVVLGGDPPAKAIYAAFPNHGGALSALLARAGLGAEVEALEGPAGLYQMIYQGRYVGRTITDGLGSNYLLTRAQFKPWPTSGVIHPFIEAAGLLVARGLRLDDIEAIEIVGGSRIKPWCEPVAERRRPTNAASAANSIQFNVAKVLSQGELTLRDYTPDGIRNAEALAVVDRISMVFDEAASGGAVRVRVRSGRTLDARVQAPLGHPSRPMSDEQLMRKFADCCRHAASPLPASDVERLADTIFNIERLDDVSVLATMANASPASLSAVAAA
jgi:2-methylcitrate dehydratase PrpD